MGGQGGKDGDDATFEARLQAARSRHGLDQPTPVPGSGPVDGSMMGIGLRVGVEMVSALVVAVGIGYGLDRWLHTSPAFLVVFVLMGGAAGVANVWRLIGPKAPPR